jgi:hypothetical protein
MNYWLGFCAILLISTFSSFALIKQSYRRWPFMANLALSCLMFIWAGMAVEFYFKVFFAQSDAYFFTLAAQNWQARYWQPVNSLDYRDHEWTAAEVAGKRKIMVVGDSVAAGVGINNYQDRFSNQLNRLLGDDTVVFNVASSGWNTRQETEAMIKYPYHPDVIILSYFINDIEGAAYHQGIERQTLVAKPTFPLSALVNNSYALNFIYWRYVRWGQQEGLTDYLAWVVDLFHNQEVWWVHQQELQTIYDGAKSEGIPLIVVVFPYPTDLAKSQIINQPVLDFFNSRGVKTLDVAPLLAHYPPQDLMASSVDAHPNELVHRLVAEQLYKLLQP